MTSHFHKANPPISVNKETEIENAKNLLLVIRKRIEKNKMTENQKKILNYIKSNKDFVRSHYDTVVIRKFRNRNIHTQIIYICISIYIYIYIYLVIIYYNGPSLL